MSCRLRRGRDIWRLDAQITMCPRSVDDAVAARMLALVASACARRQGNRCAVAAIDDGDSHVLGDVERCRDLDDARGRGEVGGAGAGGRRFHRDREEVVRGDVEPYGESRA